MTTETPTETPQQIGLRYINLERLCTAIENNNMPAVRSLVPLVKDLTFSLPDTQDTPLHVALKTIPPNIEIISLLLSRGADQAQKNKFGLTPLEYMVSLWRNGQLAEAINQGRPSSIIEAWVNEKANPNTSCNANVDVLYKALTNNNFATASVLVKHGACVTKKYNGNETVLHILNPNSVTSEVIALVQQLLDAGASLDARNDKGETPIDTANRNYNVKLEEFLKSKRKE